MSTGSAEGTLLGGMSLCPPHHLSRWAAVARPECKTYARNQQESMLAQVVGSLRDRGQGKA
eukprot:1161904-Pelagomonas_calceolata.AAC.13